MKLSRRLSRVPPYLFAEIDRKIAEKTAQGIDVISFGVGDPDIPTPESVVNSLCLSSREAKNHQYPSYFGLDEFRKTIAAWFQRRFEVELDPEREVLPLVGSKEGIAHLSLAVLDPGDTSLVPEPSYPVYSMGALLADAEAYFIPLKPENEFLPDLDVVDDKVAGRAKLLWLNYPNNPTGACADKEFFKRVVGYAKTYDIAVAHDNAYSEITFDGLVAPSLMEIEGAKDVGIEFHSLSKTFNMTGWRIGFACGNAELIEALGTVKTNIDSGVFNPIQIAGITALTEEAATTRRMRETYQARRDLLVREFREFGWTISL